MKLRIGKYKYVSLRHFDHFHDGIIVVPIAELLAMRNKSDATRNLRGVPRYMAIEPTKKELWFFPTPDKEYDFNAKVSEIFVI